MPEGFELDWLAIWRLMNVFLCLAAGGATHWRLWTLRGVLTSDEKMFITGTLLCLLALLASSVEAIFQDLPFGSRVVLVTIASAYICGATWATPARHEGAESQWRPSWLKSWASSGGKRRA